MTAAPVTDRPTPPIGPRSAARSPGRRALGALALAALVLSAAVACGRSSAADRDPAYRDGQRVYDPAGNVEHFDDGAAGSDDGSGQTETPAPAKAPPKVLIAGDSIAFFLSVPLVNHQKDLGIVAKSEANMVCGVVEIAEVRHDDSNAPDDTSGCRWPSTWAPATLASFRPDIVLVMTAAPLLVSFKIDGAWVAPCTAAFDTWYAERLSDAIEVLGASGATVVLTNVAYPSTFPEIPNAKPRTDCLNRALEQAVVGHDAVIVDLKSWVCPPDKPTCDTVRDGATLRPDGIHFTKEGADKVAAWLVPEVLRAAKWS